MQNTTTSKEIPERLIENFMIAGIQQEKLMKEFVNNDDDQKILLSKLNPDILFSMYYDSVEMEKYTQFIFPNKIQIVLDEGSTEERFHSFLTTDVKGNQSFFHCFFFYEELSKYQVMHDFNFDGQLSKLHQKKLAKLKRKRRQSKGDDMLFQNVQHQQFLKRQDRTAVKKVRRDANAGLPSPKKKGPRRNGTRNKNEGAMTLLNQKLKENAKDKTKLCTLLDDHFHDAVLCKMNEEAKDLANFVQQKKQDYERDKSVFMVNSKQVITDSTEYKFEALPQIKSQELRRQDIESLSNVFEFDQSEQSGESAKKFPSQRKISAEVQHSLIVTNQTAQNVQPRELGQSMISIWKQNELNKIQQRKITFMNHGTPQKGNQTVDRRSQMGGGAFIPPNMYQRQRNHDDNRATVNMMVEKMNNARQDSRKKSSMYSNSIVLSQVGYQQRSNDAFNPIMQSNCSDMHFGPMTANFNEVPLSHVLPSTAHFNDGLLQRSQQQIHGQTQYIQGQQQQAYQGVTNAQQFVQDHLSNFDEDNNRYASYMSQNIRQSSFKQSHVIANSFIQGNQGVNNTMMHRHNLNQTLVSADVVDEQWKQLTKKVEEVVYVPVAFVIQTKAEFHDHFKLILKKIYESFRHSKQYSSSIQNTFQYKRGKINNSPIPNLQMCMAYADLITHIAFLRTIPAPVFNSEVNILFMNQTFNFKENMFNQLPHKNQECIDKLIDCLDFHTILLCIRALLFDRTLIVFSQEISLLFNVVEGLKQLMFPFTVDIQQFLPANNNYPNSGGLTLKDIFDEMDGIQSVIFAIQTSSECNYEIYKNYENSVVLDIDASIAFESDDQLPMPKFPNELQILRILNGLRNRMRYNYDKVYPDIQDDRNMSIMEIRHVIFSIFKKFLIAAFQSIRVDEDDPQNLNDYWDQEEFIQQLEDIDESYADTGMDPDADFEKTYQNFGRMLIQSQSFVHFMDGYLDDQTVNFDVVNSILLNQRELNQRFKKKACSMNRFNQDICKTIQSMTQTEYQKLKALNKQFSDPVTEKRRSFQDNCVFFNHALPSLRQRTMLFEKIYFLNEVNRKRESRKRGHPDSFVSDMKLEDANWKLQKKIIDIVRQIYLQQYNEGIQEAEKQIIHLQRQQEIDQQVQKLRDKEEKENDKTAEIEVEVVKSSDDITTQEVNINSFASVVRNQNQKWRNVDSVIQIDSKSNSADPTLSRQASILDQIKNGTSYRASDYQSARFGDPFTQAQSRESTQVKQTLFAGEKQIRLSQIDESEVSQSFRTTDIRKSGSEMNGDLDSFANNQEDQQQPNNELLQVGSSPNNILMKSHFSSFAPHGLLTSAYQQNPKTNEETATDMSQVIEKLEKLQQLDEKERMTGTLELGDSQILDETHEQSSANMQRLTTSTNQQRDTQSTNQRGSNNQMNMSNLLEQRRDEGITFRNMDGPDQQTKISKQKAPVPQIRMSKLLEQQRDEAVTFHDPELNQQNLRFNKNLGEQSTRLSQQIEPSEPMHKNLQLRQEQSNNAHHPLEPPPSTKSNLKFQTNFTKETSADINGVSIDKKFILEADLISEFTTDGKLTKNGQIFQKTMFKLQKNEQLDNEEILMQQNLKEIFEVIEYRRDNTFIYGQRGLINFLQTLFPLNFTNSERQNLNFYFTIRENLIDYIARKQLMSSIKQIEKINQLNEQIIENKDTHEILANALRDTKKEASKSLDKADAEEVLNSVDQADCQNIHVGNLEQPERLKTFMAKNNIRSVYTNYGANLRVNPYEGRPQQLMFNESTEYNGDMMLLSSPDNQQQNQMDSYLSDQEVQNRLTTLQNDFKGQPVREQIDKAKANPIVDKSKMMLLLKQLEELQSKQKEENNWFWIEKEDKSGNVSALSETNDFDSLNQISYQEVLIIIKYFNNFENKNSANGMILQLIMNFPVMEMSHHNRVQWILEQEGSKKSIDEVDLYDFFQVGGRRDNYSEQVCKKVQIIEYIFPLSHYQCILDNMTRQEIIDFYARMRTGKNSNKQQLNYDSKQFFNQHINQYERIYPWDLPTDSQMSSSIYKEQKDYRQFQNLTQFLLFLKFIEVIQEHKQDLNNDDRGTLILQERRQSKSNSVFDVEHLLDCIGENQEYVPPLLEQANKRDSLSMGNRYFETIDERIFYQCSINQYMHERKEKKQNAKLKQIEKVFEDHLLRVKAMKEEEEQEQQQQQRVTSPLKSIQRMMRLSNNSQSASTLSLVKEPVSQSVNPNKFASDMEQMFQNNAPTQHQSVINMTLELDGSQHQGDRTSDKEVNFAPVTVHSKKKSAAMSKPPSPKNNFFNLNFLKRRKNNDDKKERAKQAKSKDAKKESKPLQFDQEVNFLKTAREGRNDSQKELLQSNKNYEESKKRLIEGQKRMKSSGHKKTVSLQLIKTTQSYVESDDKVVSPSPMFGQNYLSSKQQPSPLDSQQDSSEKFFTNNMRMMQEQPKVRGVNTQVKIVNVEPVQMSIKFLTAIIDFWLTEKNRKLLYKDQYKQYSSSEQDNANRKRELYKVWKVFHEFYDIQVDFTKKETAAFGISEQEYIELAKQCYYINIYNSLILFKLAEIASFQPKKIFDLKNYSSWLALEQNSRIMISQRMYSAYQIRYDILKNCSGREVDNFSVDPHYIHPLLDFAFFMPKHNSMKMSDLIQIFNNVENFKHQFKLLVTASLRDKLNINQAFNLIRLPFCLRQLLRVDLLKTPLEYYKEHVCGEDSQHESISENSQYLEKKSVKNLSAYELQKIKQAQILEILQHINKHLFQGGKVVDMSDFNEKNKEDVREHIRSIIVNITKALNQDKLEQQKNSSNNQQNETGTSKGIQKSMIQTNQSMSIYSGSQGQGSHSGDSGQQRLPMTNYFIEWITPKYHLKPEKLFDYNELDNQYALIFKKKNSRQ